MTKAGYFKTTLKCRFSSHSLGAAVIKTTSKVFLKINIGGDLEKLEPILGYRDANSYRYIENRCKFLKNIEAELPCD